MDGGELMRPNNLTETHKSFQMPIRTGQARHKQFTFSTGIYQSSAISRFGINTRLTSLERKLWPAERVHGETCSDTALMPGTPQANKPSLKPTHGERFVLLPQKISRGGWGKKRLLSTWGIKISYQCLLSVSCRAHNYNRVLNWS